MLQLHNINTVQTWIQLPPNCIYTSRILFYDRNHYSFETLSIWITTATPASLSPQVRIKRNQHWLDLEQWEVICQCTLQVFSSFLLLLLVNLWRHSCLCRSKDLQNSLFSDYPCRMDMTGTLPACSNIETIRWIATEIVEGTIVPIYPYRRIYIYIYILIV